MRPRVSRSWKAGGLTAVAALMSGAGALAQDAAWEYSASLYLFMAETTSGISGAFGGVESTLSFSDALSNLDFAFMGTFEASDGQWSLIADYMYTDLSFRGDTPGPAFTGADTSVTTQVLSGYVAYRVFDDANVDVDIAGGFRWFNADVGITLVGGPGPAPSRSFDDTSFDPLIAARLRFQIAPRWEGTAVVDYGGFSSDSETWQVLLLAAYEINDNWAIKGGYRYLDIDQTTNGRTLSFTQSGPILGVSYRF